MTQAQPMAKTMTAGRRRVRSRLSWRWPAATPYLVPLLLLAALSPHPSHLDPSHLLPRCGPLLVGAMTATPRPFRRKQPDGSFTPPLCIRGDHRSHRMIDAETGREVTKISADAKARGASTNGRGAELDGCYAYRDDGTVFGGGDVMATDSVKTEEEEADAESAEAASASGGGDDRGSGGSGKSDERSDCGVVDSSEAPPLPAYDGVITRSEAEAVFASLDDDGTNYEDYDDDEEEDYEYDSEGENGDSDEESEGDEFDFDFAIDIHEQDSPPPDELSGSADSDEQNTQIRGRRRELNKAPRKRRRRRRRRRRRLTPSDLPPHRRHLTGPDLSEYSRHLHHRRRLQHATTSNPAVLKCLVVLIRFSDHRHRKLPQPSAFRHFFSTEGGHPQFAPTGSVHDWYWANSRGKFRFEATVSEWIDLPSRDEAYYANGNWGWNEPNMQQGFYHALTHLDNLPNFSIESFDHWRDGTLDAVCFVHSGIPSEWGDTDCDSGYDQYNRIWSHKSWGSWQSKSGQVKLNGYFVGSAVWPEEDFGAGCLRCDSQRCGMARIGVFAHELMHDLGCPDLYDGHEGGLGVGNYDCMGNSWGWDAGQYSPPNASPWTKEQLWVSF